MRTQLRWTVGHGTARRHKSRGVRAIGAVMISSALGCTLLAQVASSQTLDGSTASVRPNEVRAAGRHQVRQLAAKDIVVDETTARRQLRTPNSQRPNRKLAASSLTSALQYARFGEAWGTQLNSPVVEGAAIVVTATAARPAQRHQAPQLAAHDVVVDNAKAHLDPKTPTIDNRDAVNGAIRTAAQDVRFGEADTRIEGSPKRGQQVSPSQRTVLVLPLQAPRFGEAESRGGACAPWGCGENSPIVDGASVITQPTEVLAASPRSN